MCHHKRLRTGKNPQMQISAYKYDTLCIERRITSKSDTPQRIVRCPRGNPSGTRNGEHSKQDTLQGCPTISRHMSNDVRTGYTTVNTRQHVNNQKPFFKPQSYEARFTRLSTPQARIRSYSTEWERCHPMPPCGNMEQS